MGDFLGDGGDAAREAADIQARLGYESLDIGREAQRRLEETLSPFVGVGTNLAGRSELFGPNAVSAISNDPALQAALEQEQAKFLAGQASRGRLGTVETAGGLSNLTSQIGSDFLSRQRGDILGGLQLGQASAAQQGAAGLSSGQSASSILSNIGNVYASSDVAAQQAQAQRNQNILGLAATAAMLASERRFKRNIRLTGIRPNGVKIYSYQYIWGDKWYSGAMVDENPHAVVDCGDYMAIDYARL